MQSDLAIPLLDIYPPQNENMSTQRFTYIYS